MTRLMLLSTLLFLSGPAAAAGTSPEELAVARDLFERAQLAQAEEDWAACERRIAEAVAIVETPGLRFHLAFCKEQQGRWVAALVDYKRSQELVSGGVEAQDVAELLGPAIQRMDADTPRLTLTLTEVPAGTTLYLDGKERSPRLIGKSIPVDPGRVRVSVAAPGHEPFERHINLLSKERRTVGVVLIPKSKAEPTLAVSPRSRARPAERGSSGIGAKGVVLIGEGALTLGALALGVLSSVEVEALSTTSADLRKKLGRDGCSSSPMPADCDELERTGKSLDRAKALELTGYVAAGVGLAAFVTTWLVWDTRDGGGASSVSVVPSAGGATAVYSSVY